MLTHIINIYGMCTWLRSGHGEIQISTFISIRALYGMVIKTLLKTALVRRL